MKRSELIEMIRRVVQEKKRTDEAKIVPIIMTRKWKSEDDLPEDIKIDWDWDWSDEYEELDGDSIIVYGNVYGKDQQKNLYKASVKATKDVFSRAGDPNDFYYYDIELISPNKTNEAKVVPAGSARVLPQADINDIDELTEYFGEGDSGFNLYKPISETYNLENYCYDEEDENDERCIAIKTLLKKYPTKTTFVSNNLSIAPLNNFPCPGAPLGSFGALIIIDAKNEDIDVYVPYLDREGQYSVGWFNPLGIYFPDTKNFDENGNYIGDGGNVIEV